jgi:hypothetical protein
VLVFGVLGGVMFLPLDIWQRLFLAMTVLFLVTSSFTLAKVIRDQEEAATIRVRLDEARIEKLLAEHNPFTTMVDAARSLFVGTDAGTYVELQGTAEGQGAAFDRELLNKLLDLAAGGCEELTAIQKKALSE